MRLSQQCRSLSLCPFVPASMLRVLRSRFEDDTVAQQQKCNQVCEMCRISNELFVADVGVDEMMLILACAGGGKCYEMMG